MPIRVSKLVYLPVGGALATGLVVSALVQPQAQLAASQACYGVCSSATTLSLSRDTISYGHEALVDFRVSVSVDQAGSDDATGTVEVEAGAKVLCRAHLSHGEGHCSPGERELGPGSYEIRARYLGGGGVDPSISERKHLEVVRDTSRTTLSLSRSTITFGRESVGVFRVAVRADAPSPDAVTGKVEVDDGSRVLCSFDLRREAGRCSLRNRQLRPGTYEIVAHYVGDLYVDASRSARERLTVRP